MKYGGTLPVGDDLTVLAEERAAALMLMPVQITPAPRVLGRDRLSFFCRVLYHSVALLPAQFKFSHLFFLLLFQPLWLRVLDFSFA